MTQPRVLTATADDVPQLTSALADAFRDDPVYSWMLPGRLRLKARLRLMFMAELEQYGLPQGTVWTTPDRDGAVVALPPGGWEMPASVTGSQALLWLRAFGTRLGLAVRVQAALRERHPCDPHYYVRTIGVRTGRQGHGLGSTLMRPTLERADADGVPTYIEASSERSAALYQRLGFVHLDKLELPDGGPPLWLMQRPPRSTAEPPLPN